MNSGYTGKGSPVYQGVESPSPGQWGLMRRSAANEGVTASAADVPGAGNQPDILNTPVAIPYDGAHTHTVGPNGTIGATGGPSTYPTNISVYYFIKY